MDAKISIGKVRIKIIFIFAAAALLLFSCDLDIDYIEIKPYELPSSSLRPQGDSVSVDNNTENTAPKVMEKNFWAQNLVTNQYYEITAKCLAYNARCEVWVDKSSSNITVDTAVKIANEFINIYNKLIVGLGWEKTFAISQGNQTRKMNTMQWADFLGDENGRLIILLLDIIDGYSIGGGYVAGYFAPVNMYSNSSLSGSGHKSNQCDMIYMDISPGIVTSETFYGTLAHETQHLMNFATSYLYIINNHRRSYMDVWIDEGLSESAEWIYTGKINQSRVNYYNNDSTDLIRQGDNFFIWNAGYDKKLHPNAVLNDYATVNIFFQWLRIFTGNDKIYSYILNSQYYSDYRAITSLFSENVEFENLIAAWYMANFLNENDGIYGYNDNPVLKTVKARYISPNNKIKWDLLPGEAVFSYSQNGAALPDVSGYIRYMGIGSNGHLNNVPAGGALLTQNVNKNNRVQISYGTITGENPPDLVNQFSVMSNSSDSEASQPYRIGAGDLLERNGYIRDFPLPLIDAVR